MSNLIITRLIPKWLNTTGLIPTVPSSNDHKDGTWFNTDIYRGEICINLEDRIIFTRDSNDQIITLNSGSNIYLNDLADVTISTGVADGEVLTYDAASGQWINSTSGSSLWAAGSGTGSVYLDNSTLNTADGNYAYAAGYQCKADLDSSFAIGVQATADDTNCEVMSSQAFSATERCQYGRTVMFAQTDSSTPASLSNGGQIYININTDHSYFFTLKILARRDDGSTVYPSGDIYFLVKDVSGTTSIVDDPFPITLSTGDAAIQDISVLGQTGNNYVEFFVTGHSSEDIRWTAFIEWICLGYNI